MTNNARVLIGRHVDELDTPVLVVDLDQFETNVASMATYCRRQGVNWRPHSKSHKSPDIARIQLAAGATGLTCAKLSEAEIFADHGVADILLANQLASPSRLEHLARRQEGGSSASLITRMHWPWRRGRDNGLVSTSRCL